MNIAAIDIGTNSVRLLVSKYKQGKFGTLLRAMHITRIGENLGKNNIISHAAASRTLDVLKEYKEIIESNEVCKYRAVGTNALRNAANSGNFIDAALKKTGLNIEIICGEEEAALSFKGATRSLDLKEIFPRGPANPEIMVLDIGGGSTELIFGTIKKPEQIISLEIGCVTLTENYKDNAEKMEEGSRRFLEKKLNNIKKERLAIIGLAGTITTVAAIDLKLEKYDRQKIHHHSLPKKNIEGIYGSLKNLDLEQRKKIKGLDPKRADIIVGGMAILLSVLNFFGQKNILVSENDILDGIIYSLFDF